MPADTRRPAAESRSPGAAFDVVALASSAGGLRALEAVLSGLPADFPAALVVVQHLDPRHRSLMADILDRHTALQVKQAEEGDQLVSGTVADQTGRCLENLAAVCHSVGATLGDAVKLTVYTTEMDQFNEINEVYESFFESDPPARVAIGVAALPRGAMVEIDAVVAIPD